MLDQCRTPVTIHSARYTRHIQSRFLREMFVIEAHMQPRSQIMKCSPTPGLCRQGCRSGCGLILAVSHWRRHRANNFSGRCLSGNAVSGQSCATDTRLLCGIASEASVRLGSRAFQGFADTPSRDGLCCVGACQSQLLQYDGAAASTGRPRKAGGRIRDDRESLIPVPTGRNPR